MEASGPCASHLKVFQYKICKQYYLYGFMLRFFEQLGILNESRVEMSCEVRIKFQSWPDHGKLSSAYLGKTVLPIII